ncbi:alpha/beta hydrolase [Ramlibacter sp. WS9]|nr:alpha/beta hydrolase [Ramlibacter sp. WS9]
MVTIVTIIRRSVGALLLAISTCVAAAPPAPAFISSTAPLTSHEINVSRVYLALSGRAPELSGLDFWAANTPERASIEEIYNTIEPFVAAVSMAPANEPNFSFVKYLYAYLLGKSYEDDPAGIQYWACLLADDGSQQIDGTFFCAQGYGGLSRGGVVSNFLAAAGAAAAADPNSHRTFVNRMLAIEYAGRIQKARGRGFSVPDGATLVRRIMSSDESFSQAMQSLDRLTRDRRLASPARRFDGELTAASLYSEARPAALDARVKIHKHLVWYNSNRDMLLAQAFLPPDFVSGSNFQAVISVHGGGWRNGLVEHMEGFNTALALQGFVVLSPMYRLTSWGHTGVYPSPTQQADIADFAALVKADPSVFKVSADRVRLFGHSAGGHLVALLGTTSNYGCVASVAAPLDLLNDFNSGPANTSLDYYVAPTARASVSPSSQSATASSTNFLVHFGSADRLVPPSQAATFQAAFGSSRVQTMAHNESHMFSAQAAKAVASATATFFQGSSCL